jgi:hypothetical protein
MNLAISKSFRRLTTLGHYREAQRLLEHGANCEARDNINATMMGYLRSSYATSPALPSENQLYRDKVRDWLLAHGMARSRVDPALSPGPGGGIDYRIQLINSQDPLILSFSPRGEGTLELASTLGGGPQLAPSPLGERAGVRGSWELISRIWYDATLLALTMGAVSGAEAASTG